jgi:hypothetical protein
MMNEDKNNNNAQGTASGIAAENTMMDMSVLCNNCPADRN